MGRSLAFLLLFLACGCAGYHSASSSPTPPPNPPPQNSNVCYVLDNDGGRLTTDTGDYITCY